MKPAARADAGTVLAFDFGTRRIGVAVGNTLIRVAHPLTTIAAQASTPSAHLTPTTLPRPPMPGGTLATSIRLDKLIRTGRATFTCARSVW